jgi:uridine kinase
MAGVEGIGVVGIAGPSCSGKTTLAAELAKRMSPHTAVLSFDEYDLFPAGSAAMDVELCDRVITNWEDPELFDVHAFTRDVAKIAQGQRVHLKTRSRESTARGETEKIFEPRQVNIVEGIFVLTDEMARAAMDLTVYVDIPLDLMVERRMHGRQNDGMPWSDPEYIQGTMVEGTKMFVLPQRALADVVLNGELPIERLADIVTTDTNYL